MSNLRRYSEEKLKSMGYKLFYRIFINDDRSAIEVARVAAREYGEARKKRIVKSFIDGGVRRT